MVVPYRYIKSDAFTANGSLGNPAAIVYLEQKERLSDNEMLAIAKAHKGFVSEVVYCGINESDIYLTYYSPECEVDFCGHGTIACLYSLLKDNPILLSQKKIFIRTNRKGSLSVYNRICDLDAIFVTAPKPEYIKTQLDSLSIVNALGISENDRDLQLPFDLINAGLRTLIVPLRDLQTTISFYPDERLLKEFCISHEIDIILVFSKEVSHENHLAHTRVFTPKFGNLEDSATGSGNSAFGYYLLKNGLWDENDCVIAQGGNDRIFNPIHLSYIDDRVLFGGSATVRIEGTYLI